MEMDGRTEVTLYPFPPFFEWHGRKKQVRNKQGQNKSFDIQR